MRPMQDAKFLVSFIPIVIVLLLVIINFDGDA